MVLVTLGTQRQHFARLLDYVGRMALPGEILVQGGHTPVPEGLGREVGFISYAEMDALVERADIVVTHGGTGSILMALSHHKKVVACARLARYGEHVDDHQVEIVGAFAEAGYLIAVDESTEWEGFAERVAAFGPARFESNTDAFIARLRESIGCAPA